MNKKALYNDRISFSSNGHRVVRTPGLKGLRLMIIAGLIVLVFVQTTACFTVARANRHNSDHENQHTAANCQHNLPCTQEPFFFFAVRVTACCISHAVF